MGILYDRYERRVRGFAVRLGARRPDDVVQDTFEKIIKNAHSFRGEASFKTWLFRVTRNTAFDAARRGKLRNMPSLDEPRGEGGSTMLDTVASEGVRDNPERASHDGQLREALATAMDQLPEDQRAVFELRTLGLSFKEIATEVGCNENTAKSRMRYALEALRVSMAPFHGASEEAQ